MSFNYGEYVTGTYAGKKVIGFVANDAIICDEGPWPDIEDCKNVRRITRAEGQSLSFSVLYVDKDGDVKLGTTCPKCGAPDGDLNIEKNGKGVYCLVCRKVTIGR